MAIAQSIRHQGQPDRRPSAVEQAWPTEEEVTDGMNGFDHRPLVLYRRWQLRPDVTLEDVLNLVRRQVLPAYRRLSDEVTLGLGLALDGRSVVAIQRWSSSRSHEEAMAGERCVSWWAGYEPVLVEWDRLVDLVDEWSSFDIAPDDG